MVKICPACGEENLISEVICRVCMTNITSVSPTRSVPLLPEAAPADVQAYSAIEAGEQTICSPASAILTMSRVSDGRALPVTDGGVIGRGGDTHAFFERDKTVSRRHAKISFRDGVWRIEDLNSTNGTWLNGKRLEPGVPYILAVGDAISLSLACELKIMP